VSDSWRWNLGNYDSSWKSSMEVLVPDPAKTLEPFGFARALLDDDAPAERDGWGDYAEIVGAA
jgi:hypothetical protein